MSVKYNLVKRKLDSYKKGKHHKFISQSLITKGIEYRKLLFNRG